MASLSACSAASPGDGSVTHFSGPWADAMQMMSTDGSDFVTSVLEDGSITDMEYQEALTLVEECYASHNATVVYDAYGFETVESLDGRNDPLELMSQCADADGGIVILFDQIRRNPENLDEEELMASCMVRAEVVDQGFTAKDFADLMQSSSALPWDEDDERVDRCRKDPLGALSEN